jgi:mono/diheme cytochrome c family protein
LNIDRSRSLILLAGLAWAVFGAGAVTVAQFVTEPGANPISADAASRARGQEIYAQMCAVCHGVQGRGDGPLSRTMVPRPSDFRFHMTEGHTEAQLFDWISNGMPDTAMQGFANELSEEDRWHVINFLQTFAPAAQ